MIDEASSSMDLSAIALATVERFRNAPREDPARPRRVRCLNPFRWLEVVAEGEVTPCCAPWFKGSLGSLKEQTLEEIWNGPRWRELRAAMFEGGDWAKFCNARTCPHIQNNIWVDIDFIAPGTRDVAPVTAELLAEVREGKTALSIGPAQIGLSCAARCNLRCIMCFGAQESTRGGALLKKALEEIRVFLPTARRIKLMGDGEVFATPESRDFLFNFAAERYPQTAFLLNTNGTLLTPELWPRLSRIKIDWLAVSIDAATRRTYEKIRGGGSWDVLMRNLECMAGQQRAGRVGELLISMCVMKSNHRELVSFAEMGKQLGVNSVFYLPILGDFGAEQIFDRHDVASLRRIARQLDHPLMSEPWVDVSGLARWRHWRPSPPDYGLMLKKTLGRWTRGRRLVKS